MVDVSKVGRLRSFSLARGISGSTECLFVVANTGPHRSVAWVGSVSRRLKSSENYRTRERDLAVNAAAIMTRTAATAMAMSQRTQSMPGLPSPPKAV
jgi:hypothetical protein